MAAEGSAGRDVGSRADVATLAAKAASAPATPVGGEWQGEWRVAGGSGGGAKAAFAFHAQDHHAGRSADWRSGNDGAAEGGEAFARIAELLAAQDPARSGGGGGRARSGSNGNASSNSSGSDSHAEADSEENASSMPQTSPRRRGGRGRRGGSRKPGGASGTTRSTSAATIAAAEDKGGSEDKKDPAAAKPFLSSFDPSTPAFVPTSRVRPGGWGAGMPATTAFDKNEARALLLPEDDAFAAAAFSPSQPPPLRSPQSAPSFANDWFSGAAGSPPLSTGSPDLPDAFNSLLSIGEMGAAAAAGEDAAAAPRPSGGAIPQLAAAAAARAAAAIAQNNYSQAASLLLGAVKANAAAAASPYARSAHASPTNDDAARVKLTEERLIAALLSSQPYDLAGADLHMDPVLQLARAAAVAAEDMHVIAGAAPGQASTRRQQQHQQAPPPSHSSQTSGRDSSQQQQGPLQRHKLYKTELCRSFEEMGYCRYGAKCQFAHGPEELRAVVRHPKYKTEHLKSDDESPVATA